MRSPSIRCAIDWLDRAYSGSRVPLLHRAIVCAAVFAVLFGSTLLFDLIVHQAIRTDRLGNRALALAAMSLLQSAIGRRWRARLRRL